jgi:hypothetical protein
LTFPPTPSLTLNPKSWGIIQHYGMDGLDIISHFSFLVFGPRNHKPKTDRNNTKYVGTVVVVIPSRRYNHPECLKRIREEVMEDKRARNTLMALS